TVAGVVLNSTRRAFTDVQVYPAIARTPFVSRGAARAAITGGATYTGERIEAPTALAKLGTLRAGQSRRFTLTLRAAQLGLSGDEGVYPLGIRVVATGPGGVRSPTPVGRANTFLPLRAGTADLVLRPAPTTVLWPFLLPGKRGANNAPANTAELAASIGARGQMRNLLDLARSTPRRGSDVVVDPSLLQALHAMRHEPGDSDAAEARRDTADRFLDDLTDLAEDYSCAAVGYDQPDVLAIAASQAAPELNKVVDTATEGTLDAHDMSCLRIEWPSARGVNRPTLTALGRGDVEAVVVSPWAVPDWDATHGNLLVRRTRSGELPLIVNDRLDDGVPGVPSALTLRQLILSESVLTGMTAGRDVAGTSTVVIVDPRFNPGTVRGQPLAIAYASGVTDPKNLAASVESRRTPYAGVVPEEAEATPVAPRQIEVAVDAAHLAELIEGLLLEPSARTEHAQSVASLVSQRWRRHLPTGLKAAEAVSDKLNRELANIAVEGPGALTLSSSTGQFPLTVRNQSPHRVRVHLGIESSAPGVQFKAPRTVDVAAGESRTVTVDVDMKSESGTTVTARLSAANGQEFGAATDFNVRASGVGAALWIAIGISIIFVAVALIRRFGRPGHRPEHPTLPPGEYDD
ncbi:MAG TPA: DUF6049 family protein, partial [Aeromicrobium sp.]|nr:DUF6049 family protein [Aeromicrobium sp.]